MSQQHPDYHMTKTDDALAAFKHTEALTLSQPQRSGHSYHGRVIDVHSPGSEDTDTGTKPVSTQQLVPSQSIPASESWDQRIDRLRQFSSTSAAMAHTATPKVIDIAERFANLGFLERRIALDVLELVTRDEFAAEKKKMFEYAAADMSSGRGVVDEAQFTQLSAKYDDLHAAYQELEAKYNRQLQNSGADSAHNVVSQRFDQRSSRRVVAESDEQSQQPARSSAREQSSQSVAIDDANDEPLLEDDIASIPDEDEEVEFEAQLDDEIDDLPEDFGAEEEMENAAQQQAEQEAERRAEEEAAEVEDIPNDGPDDDLDKGGN